MTTFSGGTTTTEAIIGTTGTAVAGTWPTLGEMLLSFQNWWLMLRRTATSPMVRWIVNVWFKVWDHQCSTNVEYFHFNCGINQSQSELSSGITTARGCGVGGDLVQYLQVELKLKRGKVKVSAGGTQTKKIKRGKWRRAGFHPSFLYFWHMYYMIEHLQGTPYVFWENSVCFSRPGFNDTQEVRLSATFPKCCTLLSH